MMTKTDEELIERLRKGREEYTPYPNSRLIKIPPTALELEAADALARRRVSPAALQSQTVPADRSVAWLIERNDLEVKPVWYWEDPYKPGWHSWTKTAADAKRFPTKEAAEIFPAFPIDPNVKATEHVFLTAPLQAQTSNGWREWTAFALLDLADDTDIDVRTADGRTYPHQPYFNFKGNTSVVAWRPTAAYPAPASAQVTEETPAETEFGAAYEAAVRTYKKLTSGTHSYSVEYLVMAVVQDAIRAAALHPGREERE